jgi:hypothetical protein
MNNDTAFLKRRVRMAYPHSCGIVRFFGPPVACRLVAAGFIAAQGAFVGRATGAPSTASTASTAPAVSAA